MSLQVKIAIFAIATIGLTWLSWRSLVRPRSHGFYRFFAFECFAALIVINLDHWFYRPFRPQQIVSWLLLITSLYLVIHGAMLLRARGKPDRGRDDPSLIGIEKTTQLVTDGLYRYIRHPLYSSLLFGTWGALFKGPSLLTACLTVAGTFFLAMTARQEEVENIGYFGQAYRDYMARTKMFVPYLF